MKNNRKKQLNFISQKKVVWLSTSYPALQLFINLLKDNIKLKHNKKNLRGKFYMPVSSMPWINIGYGNHSRNQPSIGPSTIEIRSRPFNRPRNFVGSRRSMECKRFIRIISIPYFYLVSRFGIVSTYDVIWQPFFVPLVDTIIVCSVISTCVSWNSSQILNSKRVEG